jgi:GNAT superfamily N-acetyltransferase
MKEKEFNKINFLTNLEVKKLRKKDFSLAMNILDNELGRERERDSDFLKKKFNQFSEYFIGVYLEGEIIGVVCGFPREDYLLVGEIAVDCRFQRKGFGKRLVKEFENIGFKKHNKINVGSFDDSIEFYKSLNYIPFLLIQFNKGDYHKTDFSDFKVLNVKDYGVELEIKKCSLDELEKLRKKYPKAKLQYLFSKTKE